MAKVTKLKTEENTTDEVINEQAENKTDFIPDVPAQMEEQKTEEVNPENDEILFLRHLLEVQENGGWGRHLHPIINERIKLLKGE